LAAARQGAADLAAAAGADPSGMRALDYVFLDPSIQSTLPLTRPQSPGAPDVATWAGWLHEGLSPEDILNETYPGGARADCLLFHIARQCLLEALSDDIREAIAADPTMPAAYRQDAETAREKFTPGGPYWGNMQAMIYASMLAEPRGLNWAWVPDPAYRRACAVHEALGQLKLVASADLDGALSGAIALLSWRLDAWFTRDAAEALAGLRNDGALAPFGPDGFAIGLTLGAYGVVEGLSPRQRPQTAGHVLAPSPQHAAAAGVLLSADLADWLAKHGSDYAIDLSSDRVRSALALLEGIRAGQSLGALLGYRIERHLADGGGAQMIEPLRALAPTLANLLTPGTAPAELVAASTTLDGLKLLAKATAAGAEGPSAAALAPFAPSQPALLQEALTQAAAANDALSDLLLAESVYQLVQGNAARSQAAANLMAGVPAVPGEIEVTRLPETGIAVTHRLLLQIDVPAAATDWGASPRAAADPEAEAWAAAHLPAPAATVLTVETASGQQVMTLAELLREASNRASGSIAPGALDLLLLADTPVPAPGKLLSLLEEIASGRIEPSSQGTGEIGRFGLAELWAVAHQLRACLTTFRPVRPADLPRDMTANEGLGETRRAAAISALKDLITRLDTAADAADLHAALFSAALCGLGAGPGVEPERERQALRKEADERVAQTYSGKDHSETLKALFGPLQPGLLPMQSASAAPASQAWQAVKVESTEVFAFLDKAARVRSKVASLNAALRSIDILGTGNGLIASVYQEGDPAAPWVGSESPRKAGGTGIITVSAPKVDLTSGSAVLVFVDEWTELFPAETLTGALAFHYDAPSSAPANVILLGLPRAGSEGWSDADLAATAQEALSIARMRAIDPDLLTGLGQFLPVGFLRDGSVGGAALRSLTLPPAGAP
ncbi:MAG: hypothetical protein WAW48_20320, partial [Azonexus sp.]